MSKKSFFTSLVMFALFIVSGTTLSAQKFIQKAIDQARGKEPIEVKPYVKVTHNGEQNFYYRPANPLTGDNGAARVSYNGTTLQTTNLVMREMQIARMLSGDTSVYYEVGAEQADKELRRRSYYREPMYQPQYLQSNN
jgi:hypothetical protein